MKVLCIGANYVKHIEEMGGSSVPKTAVWFWKPTTAIVYDGESVVLPQGIGEVHHEVELAVRIGAPLRNATAEQARAAVDAFTVAVDVTARDLQAEAKRSGRPWTQAKGYDTFLPLGEPVSADGVDLQNLRLRLSVDGRVRQDGSTSAMARTVGELLAEASQWTTLEPGDWILTGTPEGVGPLAPGQEMVAQVVDHVTLTNPIC